MKRFVLFSFLLSMIFMLGCVQAPVVPPLAVLYTNFQAPLDVDFEDTEMGSKEGEATCTSIMALISFGDCSTRKAAENGFITTIKHADYKFQNYIFGFLQMLTVRVYGD